MVWVLCTRTSERGGSGKVVLIGGWLLINFIVRVLYTRKNEGVVLEKWS